MFKQTVVRPEVMRVGGTRFSPVLHQRFKFSLGLLRSYIWLQPAKHVEKMRTPPAWLGRVDLHGAPKFGRVDLAGWKDKALGHHADNGGLGAVEQHFFADDVASASENALPQPVRNIDDSAGLGIVIFRGNGPPQ